MDDSRFDDLTRALADAASRRHLLRLMSGGAIGAVLTRLGLAEAAAACRAPDKPCKRRRQCCSKKCSKKGTCLCTKAAQCPQPPNLCQKVVCTAKGKCVFQDKSDGASCDGGVCCGGACVDPNTDTTHCGDCNQPCSLNLATATCVGGTCAIASCDSGFGDCDGDPTNGCETDTQEDVKHCGACGNDCTVLDSEGAMMFCSGGQCVHGGCHLGYAFCGGMCRKTDGAACDGDAECCSRTCTSGICAAAA